MDARQKFMEWKASGVVSNYCRFKAFGSYKPDPSFGYEDGVRTMAMFENELASPFVIRDTFLNKTFYYDPDLKDYVLEKCHRLMKPEWLEKNPSSTGMLLVPLHKLIELAEDGSQIYRMTDEDIDKVQDQGGLQKAMTLDEYHERTRATWVQGDPNSEAERIANYARIGLGIAGEAGEVAELFKKTLRGQDFTKDMVLKELGDVIYYVARAAEFYGSNLQEVIELNVAKLEKRQQEKTIIGNGSNR